MSEFPEQPTIAQERGVTHEADQFFAERGIESARSRRERILSHLPSAGREKIESVLRDVEPSLEAFERDIRSLAPVKRLQSLMQLGGKNIQLRHERDESGGDIIMPAFHSRYDHSELDAELAKVFGARLGLGAREIKIAMLGAWWHDLGHSAFSHTGDELLIENGWPPHEARTSTIIENDHEIETFLKAHFPDDDVNTVREEILQVTKERGALGSMQSMLDTLSYLVVDRAMIYREDNSPLAAKVLTDLVGYDDTSGRLVFSKIDSLGDMLELRLRWMRELTNTANKRTDEALRTLLKIAVEKNILTLDDIASGTDGVIKLRLSLEMEKLPDVAALFGRADHEPRMLPYFKLYHLANGLYDTREWEKRMFSTEEEAREFVHSLKSGTSESDTVRAEQVVILRPYDYTKKRIPVLVEEEGNRTPATVMPANAELHEDDTKFFVYIPR